MGGAFWRLLSLVVLLAFYGSSAAQSSGTKHGEMKHGHMQDSTEICRGFLVLKNGYAVMSGMSEKGGGGHGHHGHGDSGSMAMNHDAGMQDHLMGMKHGGDYPITAGVLCVPVHESADSWTASSNEGVRVTARSLKGALHHNSRENEAFELTVMDEKTPVEDAEVVFIAHMPHHNRVMKGGHGPANDPDLKGFEATPLGQGRYRVGTTDFTMGGSWLFEVRVKRGDRVSKAYFATHIGEK